MKSEGLNASDIEEFRAYVGKLKDCGIEHNLPLCWPGLDISYLRFDGPSFFEWLVQNAQADGSFLVKLKDKIRFVKTSYPVLFKVLDQDSPFKWMFETQLQPHHLSAVDLRPLPELPSDVNESDRDPTCVVCHDALPRVLLEPCRHLAYCIECYNNYRKTKKCPKCSASVVSVNRVYF